MGKKEVQITRFFTQSITSDGISELEDWLVDPVNWAQFREWVKVEYSVGIMTKKYDVEQMKRRVAAAIRSERKAQKRKRAGMLMAYAAAIILCFGLGFLFYYGKNEKGDVKSLPVQNEEIVLEFENGRTQTLDAKVNASIMGENGEVLATQEEGELTYSEDDDVPVTAMNRIYVPFGRQFSLVLSDGTRVAMNSGSSLRYPVRFAPFGKRQVFLEGEAYFEVTKDEKRPFVVNTDVFGVEVLGTQFDISSYPMDRRAHVVLVKGSVGLFKEGTDMDPKTNIVLEPGQKGEWDKEETGFDVSRVNTYQYVAWRQGELVFRDCPFDRMITILGRHYNVRMVNKNETLDTVIINASFRKEALEDVLGYLNDILGISYRISGNTIIIE